MTDIYTFTLSTADRAQLFHKEPLFPFSAIDPFQAVGKP